jgi:zinc transport system substrate-binding protein
VPLRQAGATPAFDNGFHFYDDLRVRSWLGMLLLVLAASGCAAVGSKRSGPLVLASAYPFTWAAQQVVGPDGTVTNLVRAGAEPHDIELSPRQIGAVSVADVVVYLKGFQPAVDEAAREASDSALLDLTRVVHAQPPDSGLTQPTSTGLDPHVWLDPVRMRAIVDAVAGKLATRDRAHAAAYLARAAAADEHLVALDGSLRSGLAHCVRHDIVTSHTAFGYLARRYGLHQVGISGLSPDGEPTPGRLAQVATFARKHDVTTIFFESLVDPKLAQTVAAEVGASTAVLDPVEGVKRGDDYLTVMARNVTALRTALGCT